MKRTYTVMITVALLLAAGWNGSARSVSTSASRSVENNRAIRITSVKVNGQWCLKWKVQPGMECGLETSIDRITWVRIELPQTVTGQISRRELLDLGARYIRVVRSDGSPVNNSNSQCGYRAQRATVKWYLQSPKRLHVSGPQMQRRPAGDFPALHWLTHAKQEPATETK